MVSRPFGVSIVICTYNGASRLPPTLQHIAAQKSRPDIPWELILVDNASTDDTAETTRACWCGDPDRLRIVREDTPGVSWARIRGIQEARFELILFVDDDNWLSPDWLETLFDFMKAHPEVGACGGWNEPVCAIEPPAWFEKCKGAYGNCTSAHTFGDITGSSLLLFGAGMAIRYAAVEIVANSGIGLIMTSRVGGKILSGEDWELCNIIRAMGWRLWRDRSLVLRHFIEARRLEWSYCRKLYRAGGASYVGHDIYELALSAKPCSRIERLWLAQVWYVLQSLMSSPMRLWKAWHSEREGDADVLWLDSKLGRLRQLLSWRGEFKKLVETIRSGLPDREC